MVELGIAAVDVHRGVAVVHVVVRVVMGMLHRMPMMLRVTLFVHIW